jgi:queuine tRNA-ribosyltransferase
MNLKNFGKDLIFLPDATKGAVKFLTTQQLKSTGTGGIVVNTLHLLINLGVEKMQELGGIKKIMGWDGYVLSDSGGFQIYSLIHSKKWKGKIDENGVTFVSPKDGSKHILTPESSIDIQLAIGADVLVCLDDCRFSEISKKQAELSVERTLKWAERCKKHFEKKKLKSKKLLSCVVQGAGYLDLREMCAKELVKMGFDGYNFGGYVVNKKGELVTDEMEKVLEYTPQEQFKYVMGVGKPNDIIRCAKMGYTVFDTVLVTRNARHGSLYSFDEEQENNFLMRITNSKYAKDESPIDSTCDCETCKNHSRAYLNYLLKIAEPTGYTLATIHNLRFYQRLIEKCIAKYS